MSQSHALPRFDYMRWAKSREEGVEYNLALSGFEPPAMSLFPAEGELNLEERAPDMPPEARALLAERFAVGTEQLMLTLGTSHALYLAVATTIRAGLHALVESPVYEALPGLVRLCGGTPSLFQRRASDGFGLPRDLPDRIASERPALVMMTNPHNPSGRLLGDADLRPVVDAAAEVGARVVVDEVYLEFCDDAPMRSAHRLGPNVMVVSSLTKAYGLGALRFGWVIGEPAAVERCVFLNDFIVVNYPNPSASYGADALSKLDALRARAHQRRTVNLPIVEAWVAHRHDVTWTPPDAGIVAFPRFESVEDTLELVARLRREHATVAVPGAFFGAPKHMRVGFGIPSDELSEGLRRLGLALDSLGA